MSFLRGFFALWLVLVVSQLSGQVPSDFYKEYLNNTQWQQATVTKKDGQSVTGLVKGSFEEMGLISEITFIAINGTKPEKYFSKDVQSLVVNAQYRFVSHQNKLIQIVYQGKRVALFKIVTVYVNPGPRTESTYTSSTTTFFLLKNGEEEMYKVTNMKKKLSAYFADCQSLSDKIKAGEFHDPLSQFEEEQQGKLIEIIGYYDYCE